MFPHIAVLCLFCSVLAFDHLTLIINHRRVCTMYPLWLCCVSMYMKVEYRNNAQLAGRQLPSVGWDHLTVVRSEAEDNGFSDWSSIFNIYINILPQFILSIHQPLYVVNPTKCLARCTQLYHCRSDRHSDNGLRSSARVARLLETAATRSLQPCW